MATDLDTRLNNALTVAAGSTTIDDDAFTAILRRAESRRAESKSRGTRVAVLGAATAVAATAAVLLVTVERGAAPSNPAQAPTTSAGGPSGLVPFPEAWVPVHLAPGLVSWYRLESAAGEEFTAIETGPAAMNMYCGDWSGETPDSVTCNDVFTEGFLPAVTYQDAQGRRIEISTIHDDTSSSALTMARNGSLGDTPPTAVLARPSVLGGRHGHFWDAGRPEGWMRRSPPRTTVGPDLPDDRST